MLSRNENTTLREVQGAEDADRLAPPPGIAEQHDVDEIDLLRSREYDLLAVLLGRAPTAELLSDVAGIQGDTSPIGQAHRALSEAAAATHPDEVSREFFDLFVGVGRGELLPYASYYLTGFLQERPLARLRDDLMAMRIESTGSQSEPEDHVATLLEIMAGLSSGRFPASSGEEARFFERNLKPWVERFFLDLERARHARFYRHVGALGRLFTEIETEAFALDG